MVDTKLIERECFKFLKRKFDKVEWLSRNSYSPIDFKCYKKRISFLVEAKYSPRNKACLSPNQHKVDAIAMHDGKNIRLLWKKDFANFVVFSRMSIIKIHEELKNDLKEIKVHPRETYSDIIQRLYEQYTQK